MTTYRELARELGFGEDWEGFLVWADLWYTQTHQPAVTPSDEVPDHDVTFYREAAGGLGNAAELVLRGAAMLDDHLDPHGDSESPWREMIDLDRFDISSWRDCLLGQVFGTYGTGLRRLGLHVGWHHGFSGQPMAGGATEADLTVAWLRYLSTREERTLASGEPWD